MYIYCNRWSILESLILRSLSDLDGLLYEAQRSANMRSWPKANLGGGEAGTAYSLLCALALRYSEEIKNTWMYFLFYLSYNS